ncbi:hypothetical protein ACFYUD_22365 [Nocardia tengchongensis]|uniref:hypothetical protein n=1 Tax=Nocardia tengchongensis TaxID=2055889 RepID=UPI0036B53859
MTSVATVHGDRKDVGPYVIAIRDGRPWAEAGGDADTTAAIVGGIVAARTGIGERGGIRGDPEEWVAAREPLPCWVTVD